MTEVKAEESSAKPPHPLSQAGISSLLIALTAIFIDDLDLIKGVALAAPAIGYGAVETIKVVRRKARLKEICALIDDEIAENEAELKKPNLKRPQKDEITTEISRLKRLKLDHKLAVLDIKIRKE